MVENNLNVNGMDGYVKKIREKMGSDLVIFVSSAACVVDDRGYILLQQRGDDNQYDLRASYEIEVIFLNRVLCKLIQCTNKCM